VTPVRNNTDALMAIQLATVRITLAKLTADGALEAKPLSCPGVPTRPPMTLRPSTGHSAPSAMPLCSCPTSSPVGRLANSS
jgi:hypothetical protein